MKSLLFHLLLCLSLLLSIKADATNSSILFKGKLPSTTTVPSFTITPGVTKQVTIDLTGSTDRLSILFIEDTYQIDMYKLVIRNNNMPETSQSADFLVAENLTLSLDTKKSLFVIQGDKKFRMSKIVREKSYDVEVEVEIVQPDVIDLAALQNQAKSTDNDKTFFYYIIAGVLGGIIGVIILVRVIRYIINRRKNIRVPRRSTQKKPSTAREVHPETHSPVFMLEEQCPELFLAQKGSINLDEKVMSEGEIEALNHLTPPNKKISLNSLTSLGGSALAQTNVTSASTLSSGFMSSSGSLNPSANSLTSVARDLESARGRRNDGSKKTTYLEAITEEPSVLKSTHPVDSGRFAREGQRDVPRILIKETTVSAHKVKLPKLNFEGKVKSMNIDGGQERFQENIMPKDPKNPTLGDIRRLAHKFMTQKQEREDSPDVSESENEEQDFKAEPANFFCCMVCKVEKRTTIAEPCGHIFACGNCVRKIIEDKKGCKLCSRRVRHYQSMKNKTRSSSQKEKV